MPIDKEGIIQPSNSNKKKKKYQFGIKDICLIVTTCTAVLTPIIMINQGRIQKMRYEIDIEELELEKTKYQNMLKENDIQLKSSYIVCQVDCIENLFDNLGSENNIKILSNDITEMFYDDKQRKYLYEDDIEKKDIELQKNYHYPYIEVIFLKIDIISNRLVKDVNLNFLKIDEEENIKDDFKTFELMENEDYYKKGKNINIEVGDMNPNDVILIPVVLQYSELKIDYEMSDYDNGNIFYENNASIFRKIYIPQNIVCYDEFYSEEKKFDIRDVLEDSLITNFYYQEKG